MTSSALPSENAREESLSSDARVCALVPHYQCERWLGQALESLVAQTRPLDRIIVVDDASREPPSDVVRCFDGVTLITAA
jgi:GT2 family glycosyltransferase